MSWGECSHGNPAQCRHEAGPHSKLTPEELGKWMNIANQNALEREAWAERYDRLHVALCQACELLNRGDSVTAHNIIRERLDAEYVEAKENAPTLPETVLPTERLVTCKGQPEPHIRIHACREPIAEV